MTALVRDRLRQPLENASSAHPGLLIQRGWTDYPEERAVADAAEGGGAELKTQHIQRICRIPAPAFYRHAFERWMDFVADARRFRTFAMKVEGRLLIGLGGGAALETGCAVSHSYGVPYLPGSSIKGVVRAYAQAALPDDAAILDEAFGRAPVDADDSGSAGAVIFYDAWWLPDSTAGAHPFVQDILTSHHSKYYGSDGETPPTDLDSPVPNALIGVHGGFLFALEGPPDWTAFVASLVQSALANRGIGAKTRAGYGYMAPDARTWERLQRERAERVAKLKKAAEETLRRQALADMPPLQRRIGELLDARAKDQSEISVLIGALKTPPWKEVRAEAALQLKEMMRAAKKWKEAPTAKRPEKDRDYQDTLQVMNWIAGKD